MADGVKLIVVVEDEPEVLDLITRILESGGYAVLGYHSAEAMLAGKKWVHAHAAVLDHGLPGADGPTLADAMRQTCPGLRVVHISGGPMRDLPPPRLNKFDLALALVPLLRSLLSNGH